MHRPCRLPIAPYICTSCLRSIATQFNRGFSQIRNVQQLPNACNLRQNTPSIFFSRKGRHQNAYSTISKPVRIAIIGSGPAGFYTAHRLLNKVQDAFVDIYEQLPVPYGLVRFGVAPDHPDVKKCQDTFEEVAQSPRFTYVGNVRVGHDVALTAMKPHYDALVFSYGASEDRKLGIPGEALAGVYSAREFVGWYNGLPQFQGLKPDLKIGEQAVVIGQGNVALDVARILLMGVDALRLTDITEQALQTLADSKIRSVRIVGRRGPLQVAFTAKEARELMRFPSIAFEPLNGSLYPTEVKRLPRIQKRIAEVLLNGTPVSVHDVPRSWALDFFKAPKSMNETAGHLSSITFTNQTFAPDTNSTDPAARPMATSEESTLDASVAFRSVGYKSTALLGLSELGVLFDSKLGIIPNDPYGRVVSPSAGPGNLTVGHLPGLYCAGWVKRGPTGVIASTMADAFASADVIAADWEARVPFLNSEAGSSGLGWDGVKYEVARSGVRRLAWNEWKRIDEVERVRGKAKGKEREKIGSVEEMLAVLDA